MNNPKYKIILTSVFGTILLFFLIYLVIFGRALGQSENHVGIALAMPKVIFSSEAVRIDDKTYLAKSASSFIKTMERQGFIYAEQLGSGYIFKKDGGDYLSVGTMYSSFFMVFTFPKATSPQADFTVGGKKPKPVVQEPKPEPKPADVILEVPYVTEAPDGNFSGPWKNACEEASIAMVEKYYLGKKSVSITEAKNFMQRLFDIENQLWGSNANSDTFRIAALINNYSSFGAIIKNNPTIQEIKNELDQKRPVITPNYGFGLQNPNIPFAPTGSSYHTEVIIGYNDETGEFIVNDSGDPKSGAGDRYGYELFMSTVRDYDYAANKANGPARVVFTFPK